MACCATFAPLTRRRSYATPGSSISTMLVNASSERLVAQLGSAALAPVRFTGRSRARRTTRPMDKKPSRNHRNIGTSEHRKQWSFSNIYILSTFNLRGHISSHEVHTLDRWGNRTLDCRVCRERIATKCGTFRQR